VADSKTRVFDAHQSHKRSCQKTDVDWIRKIEDRQRYHAGRYFKTRLFLLSRHQ